MPKLSSRSSFQYDETDLQWSTDERRANDEFSEIIIPHDVALKESAEMKQKMNTEQREAFDMIIRSAEDPAGQRLFFIEVTFYLVITSYQLCIQGAGGTGKTFIYKAICYQCILMGIKVLLFQLSVSMYSFR